MKNEAKSTQSKSFIIGRNPVLMALQSETALDRILIADGIRKDQKIHDILALARRRKVRYQFVPRRKLDDLSEGAVHQGVAAFASLVRYVEPEDILALARQRGEAPFIVVLDELEDPHNLGAIIRTAAAAGVHGIIVPKAHSAPVSSTVVKVSAGTISLVHIARVANLVRSMQDLKEAGVWFYGVSQRSGKSYLDTDFRGPVALVLGNEGKGIRRLVRENCDFFVQIPMQDEVESLNVSVSAAILMYRVVADRMNA